MSSIIEEQTEKVGYGKPPKHSQFKPKESGNPSGRPKVKRKSRTLQEIMDDDIVLFQNNKRRTMTKKEAFYASVATYALNGDIRYARLLVDLLKQCEDNDSKYEHYNVPIAPVRMIRINTVDARKKDDDLPSSATDIKESSDNKKSDR